MKTYRLQYQTKNHVWLNLLDEDNTDLEFFTKSNAIFVAKQLYKFNPKFHTCLFKIVDSEGNSEIIN